MEANDVPTVTCPYCGESAAMLYGTVTPPRAGNKRDKPRDYRWWYHCRKVIADQSSLGEFWQKIRYFEVGEKREWKK